MGGGSVAEDFDAADRAGGKRVHVDAAGASAFTSPVIVNERGVVPTLAVEKYQSVVGTEPAHRERPYDLGCVRNALPGEVDRRRQLREDLRRLGGSLRFDMVGSENIDGHCQLVGGGMAGARADYDFGEGDRGAADDKVPHDSLSFGHGDRRSRRGVAKSAKSYRVSAARHATDRVVTIVAAGRSQATRLQNNDGLADCRTGRVSDSTANCSALCGGHPWREKERKQWERQCSEQLLGRASHNTSLGGRISRTAKRPYARLPSSARKNRRTLKHAVRFKLELGELSAPIPP